MRNFLLHLRLNMSLVLAPIFLWGAFLSSGGFDLNFWLGFIAYHIFLYGGSNAYNSYYDKDEGPIGGLKNPPKVTDGILYLSVLFKLIGLVISWYINLSFFLVYVVFFILSMAYSHPYTRLKADPNFSILTIGLGQGGLAFLAGWFCHTTSISNIPLFISGIFTTIFMSMGMYPLTQLYQVEEDRKRNDQTFAVYWGITNSFRFSVICVFLSSISMLSVLYIRKTYFELILVAIVYLFVLSQIYYWAKNYQEKDILDNYEKIMKLNYSNAVGFMAYIIVHVIKII